MVWVINATPRLIYPRGKNPLPIEWVPGPVWTGAENLAPTGIRFPDRPARSESLYRLRYPSARYLINGTTFEEKKLYST